MGRLWEDNYVVDNADVETIVDENDDETFNLHVDCSGFSICFPFVYVCRYQKYKSVELGDQLGWGWE